MFFFKCCCDTLIGCAGWLDRKRMGRLGQLHCLSIALNSVGVQSRRTVREHRRLTWCAWSRETTCAWRRKPVKCCFNAFMYVCWLGVYQNAVNGFVQNRTDLKKRTEILFTEENLR